MRVVSTYAYSHWMPPYTGTIVTLAPKER
jgi:hypothetical protein